MLTIITTVTFISAFPYAVLFTCFMLDQKNPDATKRAVKRDAYKLIASGLVLIPLLFLLLYGIASTVPAMVLFVMLLPPIAGTAVFFFYWKYPRPEQVGSGRVSAIVMGIVAIVCVAVSVGSYPLLTRSLAQLDHQAPLISTPVLDMPVSAAPELPVAERQDALSELSARHREEAIERAKERRIDSYKTADDSANFRIAHHNQRLMEDQQRIGSHFKMHVAAVAGSYLAALALCTCFRIFAVGRLVIPVAFCTFLLVGGAANGLYLSVRYANSAKAVFDGGGGGAIESHARSIDAADKQFERDIESANKMYDIWVNRANR